MRPPTEPASLSPAAIAAVRNACRLHAPDFYLASFFLPRHKRQAVWSILGFCQLTIEAVGQSEETSPPPSTVGGACCSTSELDQRLALYRERLDVIYSGQPAPPDPAAADTSHLVHAFAHAAHQYEIPKDYFLDLADSARAHAAVRRYATWNRLEKHLHRSAGSIVLAIAAVLGLTHSDARRHALDLASAIALTRILRNLGPDARRGRILLPLEDLARIGYSETDLLRGLANDRFTRLLQHESDRARSLYRSALQGLPWLAGHGSRLAAATLIALDTTLLDKLQRHPHQAFTGHLALTTSHRLRQIPIALKLARAAVTEGQGEK